MNRKVVLRRYRKGHSVVDDIVPGGKLIFEHYRLVCIRQPLLRYRKEHPTFTPLAKGGKTVCRIIDAEGHRVATGIAECHSKLDNFDYSIGRHVALGRALDNFVSEWGEHE